jgi:hypothetical protein
VQSDCSIGRSPHPTLILEPFSPSENCNLITVQDATAHTPQLSIFAIAY